MLAAVSLSFSKYQDVIHLHPDDQLLPMDPRHATTRQGTAAGREQVHPC